MKRCEELVIDYGTEFKHFRTSVWRITFIFTVLVTVIMNVLLAVMYQEFTASQEQHIRHQLQTQQQRFSQLAQTSSLETFTAQVRIADPERLLVVWQPQPEYPEVVGALSQMPMALPLLPDVQSFTIQLPPDQPPQTYQGGLLKTSYGLLLLATNSEQLQQLRRTFTRTALTAILITISLTLICGYFFSKALLQRIHTHNRLCARIQQGDYNTRFPLSANHDEMDLLLLQFNRVLDTLETNLAAVRGITDNIAHDLRTPLSHLRLGLEQLIKYPDPHVQQQSAPLIEALDHCLATFNAMLSLTRIEEGQQPLNCQLFSLTALCQDLFEMAHPVAQAHDQQLHLEISSPEEIQLNGDKQLLFTALYNLVDNAMTYAGEGCEIVIRQQGLSVAIEDNGVGIADQDKTRVFDRLVRLDPSRHELGTGLGLSMVKAILTRHHAQIELRDNHPGLIAHVQFHKV